MGAMLSRRWETGAIEAEAYPQTRSQERLAVNVRAWRPTRSEWDLLVQLIPPAEVDSIRRMSTLIDRKRALLSRLLQRRCICTTLGMMHKDVHIARTKGGKPFEASRSICRAQAPNFNYNVAHDGNYVVLASEPVLLIGVDVSAPFELRKGRWNGGFDNLRSTFASCLTEDEWDALAALPNEKERILGFRRQWSLKEAFVKARGDGLAFELRRVEFCTCTRPHPSRFRGDVDVPADRPSSEKSVPDAEERASLGSAARAVGRCSTSAPTEDALCNAVNGSEFDRDAGRTMTQARGLWARVYVDGELRDDWLCFVCELPDDHIVSIARGPVDQAQDLLGHFRGTFQQVGLSKQEVQARLVTPPPPFRLLSVRDLVPAIHRTAYDDARQDTEQYAVSRDGPAVKVASGKQPEWMHEANLRPSEKADAIDECSVS